jgi:hypothetical protein
MKRRDLLFIGLLGFASISAGSTAAMIVKGPCVRNGWDGALWGALAGVAMFTVTALYFDRPASD